jgi:hypothetical protein
LNRSEARSSLPQQFAACSQDNPFLLIICHLCILQRRIAFQIPSYHKNQKRKYLVPTTPRWVSTPSLAHRRHGLRHPAPPPNLNTTGRKNPTTLLPPIYLHLIVPDNSVLHSCAVPFSTRRRALLPIPIHNPCPPFYLFRTDIAQNYATYPASLHCRANTHKPLFSSLGAQSKRVCWKSREQDSAYSIGSDQSWIKAQHHQPCDRKYQRMIILLTR